MADPPSRARHTVIIGGGVIGCTTAYFLTRHGAHDGATHRITLLEACAGVAPGASGKAGGLLGLWAHPEPLVALSFRLHAELAAEHGGAARWGYREVGCGAVAVAVGQDTAIARMAMRDAVDGLAAGADQLRQDGTEADAENPANVDAPWAKLPKVDTAADALFGKTASPLPADLNYVDGALVKTWSRMGGTSVESATAQVHPLQFTTAMADLARQAGATIITNALVTKIEPSPAHLPDAEPVVHVTYRDRATGRVATIADATDVVVAAGPWTSSLLPRAKISGLRAHSVVLGASVSPHAVFTSIQLPANVVPPHRQRLGQRPRRHGLVVDPELYARPNGEVYVCGETDTIPLPPTADAVPVDVAQCHDLAAYASVLSPAIAAAPVLARQACLLPTHMRFGREAGPLIGQTVVPRVWVAAGHSCWGVQNAPATALLVAEMLMDGAPSSVSAAAFDPAKFNV